MITKDMKDSIQPMKDEVNHMNPDLYSPSSCLSPYVHELVSSAVPSRQDFEEISKSRKERVEGVGANSAKEELDSFLLDLEALACSVDKAGGQFEEHSAEWSQAACACLPAHLLQAHRRLLFLGQEGWQEVQGLVDWCGPHLHLLQKAWQEITGGEGDSIHLLLLLTPVIERALGDLLISVTGEGKVPSLLRDLLRRQEFLKVLGRPPSLMLQLLLGSPFPLNLRNIVWHGFASPGELCISLCSCLLLLLPSIGLILQSMRQEVNHRPMGSLAKGQEILTTNPGLLIDPLDSLLPMAFTSCLLLPQHLPLLQEAQEQSSRGNHLASCLLLLPLLEAALRQRYARANSSPGRAVTAEATQLYTTFTGTHSLLLFIPATPSYLILLLFIFTAAPLTVPVPITHLQKCCARSLSCRRRCPLPFCCYCRTS